MNRLLLDTTFLVDAERSGEELDRAFGDDDDVAIAAVTLAEIRVGALLARGRRRTARAAFVDDVAATVPIVGYDATVAEAHAVLLAAVRRQGRPRGAHDLVIAATARATQRTVITADSDAFADLPGVEARSHRP
ncbi:MAG: PIN domain-containing protein [Acidimicrobiia bacterium]